MTAVGVLGSQGSAPSQAQSYAAQISQGAITLELTPRWEDGRLLIQVSATTHSGDLSAINLQQQVRLVVEGDTLVPGEAGSPRGHHAEATVAFPLARRPEQFAVVIREVQDEALRIVRWPAAARTAVKGSLVPGPRPV